jgi:hypothetical protein
MIHSYRTFVLLGVSTQPGQVHCDPGDTRRIVNAVSDLSFGEYVRVVENETRWERLKVKLDRSEFKKTLEKVKDIRNDVMHFDPDPLPEADLQLLRNFVSFLQDLRRILYGKTG